MKTAQTQQSHEKLYLAGLVVIAFMMAGLFMAMFHPGEAYFKRSMNTLPASGYLFSPIEMPLIKTSFKTQTATPTNKAKNTLKTKGKSGQALFLSINHFPSSKLASTLYSPH